MPQVEIDYKDVMMVGIDDAHVVCPESTRFIIEYCDDLGDDVGEQYYSFHDDKLSAQNAIDQHFKEYRFYEVASVYVCNGKGESVDNQFNLVHPDE